MKVFEYYFIISLKLLGDNKLKKTVSPLLFTMKSINPMQTYPLVIE